MRKLLDFRRAPAAAGPIASDTALFGLVRLHLGGPGSAHRGRRSVRAARVRRALYPNPATT